MSILWVEGVAVKTPSSLTPSKYDLSQPDSGRTLDGIMHANKLRDSNGNIVSKTTLGLEWRYISPTDAQAILTAFEAKEYFDVTYYDPRHGTTPITKTFYLGDREIPVKVWSDSRKLYASLSFTIIER